MDTSDPAPKHEPCRGKDPGVGTADAGCASTMRSRARNAPQGAGIESSALPLSVRRSAATTPVITLLPLTMIVPDGADT